MKLPRLIVAAPMSGNLIASYVHLHFLAYPELAERFVIAARHFGEQRR